MFEEQVNQLFGKWNRFNAGVPINIYKKIGSVLFEDKKNPGVFFTSPAGGLIKSINRGEKRRFISLEIEVADQENQVEILNDSDEILLRNLSKYGVINNFRTRPFNKTPKPDDIPNDIFVNVCDTNPYRLIHIFIFNMK